MTEFEDGAPGRRFVVVVEYRLDRLTPEITTEIGTIVRQRMVEQDVAGATFVSAHALIGSAAFRVIEQLSPRN